MTPLVLVELGPEEVARVVGEARAAGWSIVESWDRPARSGPVVCAGVVRTAGDASSAVLAALRGDGVVIEADAPRAVLDALCEDLRRLGPLDHRLTQPTPDVTLTDDQRALLALLADGMAVGQAAKHLNLSRRTADRRLAAARRALGAATTTEAVLRARQLGEGHLRRLGSVPGVLGT